MKVNKIAEKALKLQREPTRCCQPFPEGFPTMWFSMVFGSCPCLLWFSMFFLVVFMGATAEDSPLIARGRDSPTSVTRRGDKYSGCLCIQPDQKRYSKNKSPSYPYNQNKKMHSNLCHTFSVISSRIAHTDPPRQRV